MPRFWSKTPEEPKTEKPQGGGRYARRLSLKTGTVARKLRFDSSMADVEILEWLQEAQDNSQYSNVSFDEVFFSNELLAKVVQVFSSVSKRQRCYWDRLNVEFCQGAVDMVVTTPLLMECVKHMCVATDFLEDGGTGGLVVRLAAALRVNLSLRSLWLLVPLTLDNLTALGEALAINDSLDKLSLSGCRWNFKTSGGQSDDEGNETDFYETDDDVEFVDSRWASSDDDDDDYYDTDGPSSDRIKNPQLAEQYLKLPIALAEGFRNNTSVRTVDLSSCSLPDEALGTLLEALVGHPLLETLDISQNRAGTRTVRAMADMLAHPNSVMTTLDLREQRKAPRPAKLTRRKGGDKTRRRGHDYDVEAGDEDDFDTGSGDGLDIFPLTQSLYNNDILQVLRLSHNGLVDDQISELVRNLQGNETLQELDLQFNAITTRGLKILTKGLSELPALKELLLGGNAFGKEGNDLLAQLEDDDDSVCTIMENGGTGGGGRRKNDDDDDTFHSAKSSGTHTKQSKPNRTAALGARFMGGLTGISEK